MVTGPNGAGKTNLLEAIHLAAQGFSPRTRSDAQLVRAGESSARVTVRGRQGLAPLELELTLSPEGKRACLNGAPVEPIDELRRLVSALAFVPDRLAVAKGGPLVRRLYLDRMLGRVLPPRSDLPAQYGRALAQRNAALRRASASAGSLPAVAPWTEQVARLGTELTRARTELVELVRDPFVRYGSLLGLPEPLLAYSGEELTVAALDSRLSRDLERGSTGTGPHLADLEIASGARDLRHFGSQGEQRCAVLALTLAEADVLTHRRGAPPLLLLDDVLSELDRSRRSALLAALPAQSQTILTATAAEAVPAEALAAALVVRVEPGEAVRV